MTKYLKDKKLNFFFGESKGKIWNFFKE